MNLRHATPADVPILFDIRCSVRENHQSREELAALGVTDSTVVEMLQGDGPGWLAEIDDKPVGFAMVILSERTVFACFIRPGFEGRGIGRRLMEAAEAELRRHSIQEAWLTTGADPAIRANVFYQALG
ncbi:GNAT family N-acetyltransferase [Hymenobacter sp. HDW8]|uniref:GNAT family N-acetyltransferase n=1 Tax=Hymenobacter sp. HDW8 TaxID=2714932 RepID=UPI00140AD886|nr:GNAT family N-acetyltransferase [Hymenobacter sp. HDW8]QIL75564.1 GNAT family N-acetyltransferase [Hymenobacter sp. HDW8]